MATPADLTALKRWHRAKDLGAAGTSIATWVDRSPAGRDAIATGGTAPVVAATATPNGGKAVQFSGSGHLDLGDVLGYGGTVVSYDASSHYPTEPPANAFDLSPTTYWTTDGVVAAWLRAKLSADRTATSYSIRRRDDIPARNPTAWTFEGSIDGTSWTVLDTRSGITWGTAGETKTFSIATPATFRQYRINITANGGDGYTSIAELALTYAEGPLTRPAEAWLVVKAETDGNNGLWSWNSRNAGNAHTFYPYQGSVYETFGVAAANTPAFSTSAYPINQWRLYRVTTDGVDLKVHLDGALVATLAVPAMGGVEWGSSVALGATFFATSASTPFTGKVAEFFTRSAISTSAEVADLITYFNTEHGLTVPGGSTPPAPSAEGGVAAVSAVVGEAAIARAVEGAVAAVSTVSGDPDPDQPAVQHPAEGAVAAVSAIEGEADVAHVHHAEGSIDASTDVTGEAQVERCAEGTVAATSAVKGEPTILAPSILAVTALAGSETQIGRVERARILPTPIEALAGSVTEITGRIQRVTIIGEVIADAGSNTRVVMPRDWGEDPRTGRPSYRLRIVKRDGSGVVELDEATITPETEAINTPDSFSFKVARANKKARRVLAMAHQAQLWRGKIMLTKGDIGPARAEGPWITFDVKGPSALLFDGRVIGRIPKRQLLRNADFTKGLAYWTGAYGPDSALKAPPTARVVDEDYAASGKALELGAVDKAVTTKVDVKTSAVFVPNKATYLKGGEDKIKAVGANIPEGATIRLTGFTANDHTGDGLALSLARAQAAKATLAGMGKKFVFKLPENWSKIDPGKRRDDGTVGGRGYYQQIPGGLAANRRVTIAYEGVQKAEGHQQYYLQKLTVMQPTSAKVPLTLTFAGDMRILRWDGAPKDGWAMRLILEDIVATK
ncbi:MAG TPA: discoidin domain-containing protein, partial [Solirubrobacteraceae bacterium]|nr:discoidin domain-containing protein [Solirubrobacteraceae bacterium]